MQEYIIELSRYFIMIFMVLYALLGFYVFRYRDEERRKPLYVMQNVLMFLVQVLGFLDLSLVSGDIQYLFFFAFIQIFLFAAIMLVSMIYEKANRLLLNNMCMLLGIGLCMVARLSFNKAIKQYVIVLMSFVISLFIPWLFTKVRFLKKFTWLYAAMGVGLLSIVLIVGEATHGSKISFSLGGVTFQPSEFVKILFLFFLAGALWEDVSLKRVILTAVVAGLHVMILVISRDLGSALIFFVGFVMVVFVASRNYLYLLAGAVGGSAAAYVAYLLFDHVKTRVLAWQDPWSYIDAQGYQITQSLFAVGSGSWFGMGLLKGNPKAIPYVDADFIFSSICEEFGVIFGICLVLICVSSFIAMMNIAIRIHDRFYQMIVYGIGVMYIFQIFLTIGGGIKFIPLTGVTLPFISYGGSSVMTTMFMFFIIQGIYIRLCRQEEDHPAKPRSETSRFHIHLWNEREILLTAGAFSLLFAGMIGYLCHFVATSEQDMINNSYNSRQEILLSRNYRGSIYSRDGEVLAETVLDAEENEERVYPFGNLFSHIVGYSTQGRMGVEAQANYYLINTNTSLNNKVANDMAGKKNPGDNVYTTLDVQIQKIADEQLNVYKGAVVVTEVKTGKILAMVSHPDFDPNEIETIWDDLVTSDSSSILVNRATQGLYPPGSTFKIVTALEYYKENKDSYRNYSYTCNGSYRLGDSKIGCYHGTNHGVVGFQKSFAKSCNASFANIGMSLDKEKFAKTLDDLLFGRELPLTLNYAKSSVQIDQDTPDADMMQTSIGQGKTQITPMHLNMITCAIANDGVLMKPYVIDRVENDAGNTVKTFKPSSYGRLMSEDESAVLKELMTAVVEEGTATKLKGLDYTAAGKTGSAEYNNVKGDSHAWFTGFAPAEDPEVCVTIIVEGAGSGGDYAVPIAKRLFDAYFAEKTK